MMRSGQAGSTGRPSALVDSGFLLYSPPPTQEGCFMPFPPNAADLIRAKLDAGILPSKVVGRMYAGYGDGNRCDGCETSILRAQVEYEFDSPEGSTFRFHLG